MNKSLSEAELADILESALEQHRRGHSATLDELVRRYPQHARQIRDVFPALMALEKLGCDTAPQNARPNETEVDSTPAQLGDFAIIREIGRGGMGIVYEAVQQSLGRHIALKVLSPQLAGNPRFVERFQREAQAAGRLHHTNIVPVFSVGQDQGVHFYAMQFIQGNGLDLIIDELRRQRPAAGHEIPTRERTLPVDLATRLLRGTHRDSNGLSRLSESTEPVSDLAVGNSHCAPDLEFQSVSVLSKSTMVAASGGTIYFRNAARICQQAAEALAYAHEQGILHRDIKPSNLMLDVHGTAWITDFGLAKEADSTQLTGSGDVMGTLRYMSPEQFAGRSGCPGDIYGLGASLYELLTLEPPFSDSSRSVLLEKILRHEPKRPCLIDSRIPRDLETIVLKALEKEPRNRYRSAKDLADDLGRFLNDLPVMARRTSQLERVWRWCRRNRGWAATLSLLLFLSVVVLPILQGLHANRLSREVREVAHLRGVEEELRVDAQTKLAESYLREATATRLAGKVGLRSQALNLVKEATQLVASLPLPPQRKIELLRQCRCEAVAALTALDLERIHPLKQSGPATGYQVSASMENFICVESPTDDSFTVRRVIDQTIVAWFDGAKFDSPLLSPDGMSILVRRRADYIRELWSVKDQKVRFELPPNTNFASFSQDGQSVAAVLPDSISIIDANTGLKRHELRQIKGVVGDVGFDPDANRLALVGNESVWIWQLAPQPVCLAEIRTEGVPRSVIWSPKGDLLAIELLDGKVELRESVGWTRQGLLTSDRGGEIRLSFSSDGSYLSGIGWSGVLRIWNVVSGKLVFEIPSIGFATFAREGSRIAPLGLGTQIGVWQISPPQGHRVVAPTGHLATYSAHLTIHPNGRIAAVTTDGGLYLYDLHFGQVVAVLPYREGCPVFDNQGRLWLSSLFGVLRFSINETADSQWSISEPEVVIPEPSTLQLAVSADGHSFALAVGAGALVQRSGDPTPRLVGGGDTRYVALSPDGRWLATGNHNTVGCRVYSVETLEQQCELADFHAGNPVTFSADSRQLSIWTGQYRIISCQDWKEVWNQDAGRLQMSAISPEGTWFASDDGQGGIELVDLATRQSLLKLQVTSHERTRCLQFTPNGALLLAISFENPQLQIWDLRGLSRQLANLGLGWADGTNLPEQVPRPGPLNFDIQLGELGWTVAARLAFDSGLYGRAIQAYEKCLELQPGKEQPANMLAWTLLVAQPPELRDPKRAETLLASIAGQAEAKPATIHTWALALYRNGKLTQSNEALRRLESRRPIWTADEHFLEALLFCDEGKIDNARQALEQATVWVNQQTQLTPLERSIYDEFRLEVFDKLNR